MKTPFHDWALAVYAERAEVVVAQVRSAVPELMESVPDPGHHAVLLSRTSSSTSTTVSPPALSRRPTANSLSTQASTTNR